jgi:hypothetical protein
VVLVLVFSRHLNLNPCGPPSARLRTRQLPAGAAALSSLRSPSLRRSRRGVGLNKGRAIYRKKFTPTRSYQVLRYQDDPNRIVHLSAWTSIEDARRFFESPKLVKIRAEAGVKAPDFIYLDQIEAGTL